MPKICQYLIENFPRRFRRKESPGAPSSCHAGNTSCSARLLRRVWDQKHHV